jgi:hypothetical protein
MSSWYDNCIGSVYQITHVTSNIPVLQLVNCVWNVMAHVQKTEFVFLRNGRAHLNLRESQFSRLLAAEVCASAVVMLDKPCSEVVWRVHLLHHLPSCSSDSCTAPDNFISHCTSCVASLQLAIPAIWHQTAHSAHPTYPLQHLFSECAVHQYLWQYQEQQQDVPYALLPVVQTLKHLISNLKTSVANFTVKHTCEFLVF